MPQQKHEGHIERDEQARQRVVIDGMRYTADQTEEMISVGKACKCYDCLCCFARKLAVIANQAKSD